jgi:Uma2 family endonuclease
MKGYVMTYPEYLTREATSEIKHEYLRGDVWAMESGTPTHARLCASLAWCLGNRLQGKGCTPYSADLRVRIEETDRSTYPDPTIICGPEQAASDDKDAITNPTVIIEVLSDSTERSDRGEKFAHYQRRATLREYVLVAQDSQRIEVFRREGKTWVLSIFEAGATVRLESLAVEFPLAEVYAVS